MEKGLAPRGHNPEESAEIEPDGEAATALEQARAIMAFYNKDLYNP